MRLFRWTTVHSPTLLSAWLLSWTEFALALPCAWLVSQPQPQYALFQRKVCSRKESERHFTGHYPVCSSNPMRLSSRALLSKKFAQILTYFHRKLQSDLSQHHSASDWLENLICFPLSSIHHAWFSFFLCFVKLVALGRLVWFWQLKSVLVLLLQNMYDV